jgi:hypothetical protein
VTRGCSVEGCTRSHAARGYCKMHHQRLMRSGSVDAPLTPVERFWARVQPVESGCWLWTGPIDRAGYGRTGSGPPLAHRFAWQQIRGALPELELDHLCRVRACVNPDHLEPVTRAVNNQRAALAKETCKQGHPWTAASTLHSGGQRRCRVCMARSHADGAA